MVLVTVTDVQYLRDVEKWFLETPRGNIIANKVVIATNAYTAAILPEFKGVIVPVKGCVSHLKPADHSIKKLPYNYYHAYPMEGDYVTARSDGSSTARYGKKKDSYASLASLAANNSITRGDK
ncbi:hypothetical protein BRETT_003465 [Brettanomyces bruxellensis]|uniref:FAD dependent oxidoreductase domain-containing protein n=1 Tax=Dekkera bruxellensis TaxID=5007 RepID=A0A871R6F4_DEKBR|nr:uncharacterized protein BRETT_003465 [Brettanomyces bruxellensis]QOU19318.1 hypothetical protein BRETT_003465 [Brettanomyces bruxellensis]